MGIAAAPAFAAELDALFVAAMEGDGALREEAVFGEGVDDRFDVGALTGLDAAFAALFAVLVRVTDRGIGSVRWSANDITAARASKAHC